MTGYQEVATDPSFEGQIVCFTAPMVGNYGVDETRTESRRAHARAVVMREARGPEWTDWLHEHGVVGLTGVDTRSLVLHLRERGAMRAAAVDGRADRSTRCSTAVRAQPEMAGAALVAGVSTTRAYTFAAEGAVRVAVVDYGCKRSILRRLAANGAAVDVFPHDVDADTLAGYDGVLLSPGPGRSRAARRTRRRCSASCSGARPCSASASAISCSRSRPARRRSSCRSAIAAPTIRCSTVARGGCSSRPRTTASRSQPATRRA